MSKATIFLYTVPLVSKARKTLFLHLPFLVLLDFASVFSLLKIVPNLRVNDIFKFRLVVASYGLSVARVYSVVFRFCPFYVHLYEIVRRSRGLPFIISNLARLTSFTIMQQ